MPYSGPAYPDTGGFYAVKGIRRKRWHPRKMNASSAHQIPFLNAAYQLSVLAESDAEDLPGGTEGATPL
jgi:hypothetical protein